MLTEQLRAFLDDNYIRARRFHDPDIRRLADLAENIARERDLLRAELHKALTLGVPAPIAITREQYAQLPTLRNAPKTGGNAA